jgi:hypothetical protein
MYMHLICDSDVDSCIVKYCVLLICVSPVPTSTQVNTLQICDVWPFEDLSMFCLTLFLIDSYIKLNYLNYNLDIHGRTKLI